MKKKLLNCICPQSVLLKIKQCFPFLAVTFIRFKKSYYKPGLYSVLWGSYRTHHQLHRGRHPLVVSYVPFGSYRQSSIHLEKKKKRQAVANINTGERKQIKKGTSTVDFQEDRPILWDEPLSYREYLNGAQTMRESFQKESKSNGGRKLETPLHLNDQRYLNKTLYLANWK